MVSWRADNMLKLSKKGLSNRTGKSDKSTWPSLGSADPPEKSGGCDRSCSRRFVLPTAGPGQAPGLRGACWAGGTIADPNPAPRWGAGLSGVALGGLEHGPWGLLRVWATVRMGGNWAARVGKVGSRP